MMPGATSSQSSECSSPEKQEPILYSWLRFQAPAALYCWDCRAYRDLSCILSSFSTDSSGARILVYLHQPNNILSLDAPHKCMSRQCKWRHKQQQGAGSPHDQGGAHSGNFTPTPATGSVMLVTCPKTVPRKSRLPHPGLSYRRGPKHRRTSWTEAD